MENNIEDGIIGCILLDTECLYKVYDKIKPEMFTSNLCRRVYEKMLVFFDTGKPFDATILANELADEHSDKDVFMKQFSNLIMATPTSSLINGYTDRLIANYQASRLHLLLKDVDTNPSNIKATIGELMTRLEEIQVNEKKKSKNAKEISDACRNNYFDGNKTDEQTKVKTGLHKLDECISLDPGDITIIGARPSVGKSALALQIAKYVSEKGLKVGYFNLEMLENQIYERFIASMSGIPMDRIKNAHSFLGDEKEKFLEADRHFQEMNIVISTGGKTDLDIKAESRHQHFDLIVIDYLQLVRYHGKAESRRVEVGEVSRSLKSLATELKVPIVLLSQLTRKTEYTQDKEPSMADLRETGDIEQDASTIILMWNLEDEGDYKEFKGLKVDKNRQGKLMTEGLDFIGENMTFVETKETIEQIKAKIKEFRPAKADDDSPFI